MPLPSHLGQRIKNREIRQGLELGLLSQQNDWQAEAVVEQRWTQVPAWAACILYRAGNDERRQEFYALASAWVQGRALEEIPLMYKVASRTVSAWEHRLDG
jgi:hypothetical protein